jgi:chemotaxis protein CheD
MPNDPLVVGLGECKLSRDPADMLVAYGLGSCVGVGMYDPRTGLAGLLHAVLPENTNGVDGRSAKFVTSGVPHLIEQLEQAGADRSRLVVRIVGGANMLTAPGLKNSFNIGERNVAAAHSVLAQARLRIQAEDTGGHTGRTVRLFPGSGRMTVRVLGNQERDL